MHRSTSRHATSTAFRAAAALAILGTLAIGLLVLAAPRALAGGPTSVLIVNYDGSRAAAAVTGSRDYEDLAKSLDALSGEPPRGETAAPSAFMGTGIRLTWLVHDVTPWRLDALRLDGDQIWVNTVVAWEGDLFDHPGVWHRPADEALLRATLTSMGIFGPTTAVDAPPARPVPGDSAKTSTTAGAGSVGRPAWALAATGLVGLLLGWSGHRLARGRSTPQPHGPSENEAQSDAAGTTQPGKAAAQTNPAAYQDDDPVSRFTLR